MIDRKHIKKHFRLVVCPKVTEGCFVRKGDQKEMTRHVRNNHRGLAAERGISLTFSCDHPGCGTTFTRECNLRRHERKQHGARGDR